ncbi:hypothetical protein [Maricaulis sp.]|uniref:hypothetical protein n=1 Tax=Maricaulis sp. TaxID=1486257 RepID=UPI002636E452|nr:hypothetical protein [Maricaulis sp.]
MMRVLFTLFAGLSLTSQVPAFAQSGPIEWHSENVQLLRGFDYELGDEQRTIITFEHANRWSYGDMFLFADFTFGDDGQTAVYGEFTPRLSLARLSGRDPGEGLIRDVLLAGNYERGEQGLQRYLAGFAVDLNVEGFRFLRTHAYYRDDPERPGSTWQATIVWNRPFEIGGQSFLSEGFADIAGAEGPGVANQLYVPRFLWDAGAVYDRPGRIFLGVEWQYWNNKFGVDGVTENVAQLQLKWVLN